MSTNKKPGWYYIGNGRLRYMNEEGWTDQYRNASDPAPPVHSESSPRGKGPAAETTPDSSSASGSRTWLVALAAVVVTALAVSAVWASGTLDRDDPVAQFSGVATQTSSAPVTPTTTPSTAEPPTSTTSTATTAQTIQAPPAPQPAAPVEPQPAAPAAPPETADNDFNEDFALAKAADIIEDITALDQRVGDGIAMSSGLRLLSDSYGRLASAGVPPGLDPADYLARVTTLQDFTADAADLYYDNPNEATAKYLVAREETGTLFDQINGAIGSELSLP